MSQRIAADAGTGRERLLKFMKVAVMFLFASAFALCIVGLNASFLNADIACDCSSCHSSSPHGSNPVGCSGCHDTPPQTGSHLIHYGSTPTTVMAYGDTGVSSTREAYKFGCGNCHALDFTKHNNGWVDVELYDPHAPAGSLKAMNPSDAAYTSGPNSSTYQSKLTGGRSLSYSNGTCNNIYCHSGYTIASSEVSYPIGTSPRNLTYEPYTVTYSRVYKATPEWGVSGATATASSTAGFLSCTECHAFPLITSYPTVSAGVGDSHGWVDDYGYVDLHAWNMGSGSPVMCRTCHYGTVTTANTYTYTESSVVYGPVPLASRELHVNGSNNVVLDTANTITYNVWFTTKTYNLSGASYDPVTKSCSNVGCHREQTRVTWGTPYRYWISLECAQCHESFY